MELKDLFVGLAEQLPDTPIEEWDKDDGALLDALFVIGRRLLPPGAYWPDVVNELRDAGADDIWISMTTGLPMTYVQNADIYKEPTP